MSGFLTLIIRVIASILPAKDVPVPSLEAAFSNRYVIPDSHFHAMDKPIMHDPFDYEYTYKKQIRKETNTRTRFAGRIHSRAVPLLEKLLKAGGYKYRINYINDTHEGVHSGWYVQVCDPVYLDASARFLPSQYVQSLVTDLNNTVAQLYG